jgi:hypothetical protein
MLMPIYFLISLKGPCAYFKDIRCLNEEIVGNQEQNKISA